MGPLVSVLQSLLVCRGTMQEIAQKIGEVIALLGERDQQSDLFLNHPK